MKPFRNHVNGPQAAAQGPPQPTVGEPTNAARKGAHIAVDSDPHMATGEGRAAS